MIILVVGKTGAGKTTYAKKLEETLNGVLFSIDHWMVNLYWQDMPQNPDMMWFQENQEWYLKRIQRCEDMISNIIPSMARSNTPSILDLGFTSANHRCLYIKLAEKLTVGAQVHFLDIPKDKRWQQVQQRNNEKGESYTMQVSREMFDYMENIFEPPTEQEKKILKKV